MTDPYIILTTIAWAVSLGVQVGLFWSLRAEFRTLKNFVEQKVRTREEGDEITKRFDSRLAEQDRRLQAIEARLTELEP
jgi:hypothetical protein